LPNTTPAKFHIHPNSNRGKSKQQLRFQQKKKPMLLKHILKHIAAGLSPIATSDIVFKNIFQKL